MNLSTQNYPLKQFPFIIQIQIAAIHPLGAQWRMVFVLILNYISVPFLALLFEIYTKPKMKEKKRIRRIEWKKKIIIILSECSKNLKIIHNKNWNCIENVGKTGMWKSRVGNKVHCVCITHSSECWLRFFLLKEQKIVSTTKVQYFICWQHNANDDDERLHAVWLKQKKNI